jgi:predicted peptidase
MPPLVLLALVASILLAQAPPAYRFAQQQLQTPDGTTLLYGRAVPGDYDPKQPRPLVLALHPGGEKTPYYGAQYMRAIFLPGLRDLAPIMVAPDCPTRSWTDPAADRAVMALMQGVLDEYSIDRRRILVVGFSLGGQGTWFMESRHPDLFTAAIVMAGRTEEPLEGLARVPTYVIHSRADEVVPFGQAEERAAGLERMGRPVRFDPLDGVGHFDMAGYLTALARGGRWVLERWGAPAR